MSNSYICDVCGASRENCKCRGSLAGARADTRSDAEVSAQAANKRVQGMTFSIRFKIANRLGAASKYSLRDLCISVVDRYSLRESELCTIVTLRVGETWSNNDMEIRRVK